MYTLFIAYFACMLVALFSVQEGYEKRFFLFVSFFILLLFIAFRSVEVGTDTAAYYHIFERISMSGDSRFEPVFHGTSLLVHKLGGGPEVAMALFGSVAILLIARFVMLHSPSYMLSLSLFLGLAFYFYNFNIVRQGVAIAITCTSVGYIVRREHFKFLLLTVLAFGFHFSAAVFYFAYYLRRRISMLFLIGAWLVSLASLVVFNPIDIIFWVLSPFISDYYQAYFLMEDSENPFSLRRFFLQAIYVLALVVLWKDRQRLQINITELTIINIAMAGIVLSNLLARGGWLGRISDYYDMFVIVAVPILVYRAFKSQSALVVSLFISMICFMLYYRFLAIGSHGVIPFNTWLF